MILWELSTLVCNERKLSAGRSTASATRKSSAVGIEAPETDPAPRVAPKMALDVWWVAGSRGRRPPAGRISRGGRNASGRGGRRAAGVRAGRAEARRAGHLRTCALALDDSRNAAEAEICARVRASWRCYPHNRTRHVVLDRLDAGRELRRRRRASGAPRVSRAEARGRARLRRRQRRRQRLLGSHGRQGHRQGCVTTETALFALG